MKDGKPRGTGTIYGHPYEVFLRTPKMALIRLPLPPGGLSALAWDIARGAPDVVMTMSRSSKGGDEYLFTHPNFTATLSAGAVPGKASMWLHPRRGQCTAPRSEDSFAKDLTAIAFRLLELANPPTFVVLAGFSILGLWAFNSVSKLEPWK
jgi:hypothetical protein